MKRFQNILFARNAEHNQKAMVRALALAKRNQARLSFLETPEEISDVSVFGLPNETVNRLKQAALKHSRQDLEELEQLQGDRGSVQIEFQVVEGIRFLTIIREVLRGDYDLVIKAAEGHEGFISSLFSTTDMHLLRKCPCPLWLMKTDGPETIKQIVAAVDFDLPDVEGANEALNQQIVEMAISLAHVEGAELQVVHAWQSMNDLPFYGLQSDMAAGMTVLIDTEDCLEEVKVSRERSLSMLMHSVRDKVGPELFDAVKPVAYAIRGGAEDVITEQVRSDNVDLLVMGTMGRVGIPGFFIGNTAESILNQIDCSVLAVKPAGFKSPVTLE